MRNVALLACLALGLMAGPARAADPIPGVYHSIDLGGDLELGRVSQSWAQPLNAMMGSGDVIRSYGYCPGPCRCGSPPCEEWSFTCGIQSDPQQVQDLRDALGTGPVVVTNVFVGGTFFLHGHGPWGPGDPNFTGVLQTTRMVVTVDYLNTVPQGSQIVTDWTGAIDGSHCYVTFQSASGVRLGDTDVMPIPSSHPELMDPACQWTREYGMWGDLNEITLTIDCATPARSSTWGSLKTFYR